MHGCCGTLEARRPLAIDVWHNARASAFCDPRYAPFEAREWVRVDTGVSLLTPREPVDFLRHLKQKTGWSPDFWAEDVEVWRYFTESVAAPGTNRRP